MAKYSQTIEYNLRTTLDSSGIQKLQSSLLKVQQELRRMGSAEVISNSQLKKIEDAQKKITVLSNALTKSYKSRFDMLDMKTFNKELAAQGTSVREIGKSFSNAGLQGKVAFASTLQEVGKLDTQLNTVSKTTDKIFNSIGNTVRWGVISSIFNRLGSSLQDSVQYVKELDNSLTNIMMVTDYSRAQMGDYARQANEAAKAIGATTTAMTNASLVFAQQGFGIEQSQQLAELSTKVANASGQTTDVASAQVTAYMNAYGLDSNMAQLNTAMDSWALVANVSAADVQDLAVASQKAASSAATVGVSMDQLNGQIAAISSVTQEAPEQIGNGLKTLYARLSDIQMGETLEDGVDLGKVTSTLENIGVQVLDGGGQMRNVGDIMEDLMDVWSTLNQTEKAAIAQTLAGKHQLARFEALMNRSDLYEEYKIASENADGTLDEMNAKYMDSIEGRMNKIRTTIEGIFTDSFNTEDFYGFLDGINASLDMLRSFVNAMGGANEAMNLFILLAGQAFKGNIAQSIAGTLGNLELGKKKKDNAKLKTQFLEQFGLGAEETLDQEGQELLQHALMGHEYSNTMNSEQKDAFNKDLGVHVENYKTRQLKTEERTDSESLTRAWMADLDEGAIYEDVIRDDDSVDWENLSRLLQGKDNQLTPDQLNKTTQSWKRNLRGVVNETSAYSDNVNKYLQDALLNNDNDLKNISKQQFADFKDKMSQTNLFSGQELEGLTDLFDDIIKLDGTQEDNFDDMVGKINKLQNQIDAMRNRAQKGLDNTSAPATNEEQAQKGAQDATKEAADAAAAEQERLARAAQEQTIATQAAIQNTIGLVDAIGQVGFALINLNSIPKIWDDDSLSNTEKLKQTLLSLGTSLPLLINGFSQLSSSGKALIVNTSDLFNNFLGSYQQGNSKMADRFVGQLLSKGAITKAVDGKAVAGAGEAIGGALAKTSAFGFKSIFSATMSTIGPQLIAVLVASLVGLLLKMLWDEYNKAEIKAKEAAEKTKKEVEQLNALSQEKSELESNLSSLNNANEALSSAEKGTREWKEALIAVNNEVLTLIERYPELANSISKGVHGELVIDPSALEQLQEDMSKKVQREHTEVAIKKKEQTETEIENEKVKLGRKIQVKKRYSNPNPGDDSANNTTNASEAGTSAGYTTYTEDLGEENLQKALDVIDNVGVDTFVSNDKADIDAVTQALRDAGLSSEVVAAIMENKTEIASFHTDMNNKDLASEEGVKAAIQAEAAAQGKELSDEKITEIEEKIDNMSDAEAKQIVEDAGINTEDDDAMRNAFIESIGGIDPSQGDHVGEIKNGKLTYTKDGVDYTVDEKEMTKRIARDKLIQDEVDKAPSIIDPSRDGYVYTSNTEVTSGNVGDVLKDEYETYTEQGSLQGELSQEALDHATELLKGANLTDEELSNLLSNIDLHTLVTNSDEIATELKNGADVNDVIDKYDVSSFGTDNSKTGAQEVEEVKADFGISDEDYEKYSENIIKNSDELSDKQEEIKKQQEEINRLRRSGASDDKIQAATDVLNKQVDAMKKVVAQQIKLEKGTKEVNQVFDKSAKIIRNEALEGTTEYTDAIEDLVPGIEHMLDIDMSDWDMDKKTEFIAGNLDLISAAANGDVYALQALKNQAASLAAEDYMAEVGVEIDSEEGQQLSNSISAVLDSAQNILPNLEVGATITDEGFIDNLNSMYESVLATGGNIKDFLAMTSKMGIEVETVDVPQTFSFPNLVSAVTSGEVTMGDAFKGVVNYFKDGEQTLTANVKVPKFTVTDDYDDSGVTVGGGAGRGHTTTTHNNNGKDTGGGGNKGKSSKPKHTKPLDEKHDRYEKINTQLGIASKELEKISDEEDRLVGQDKLNNLEKQCDILREQITLQKEKLKIQKQEAAELKKSLSKDYGVHYDAEGVITNYKEVFYKLQDEVNAAQKKADKDSENEAAQNALDKAKERFDEFKKDHDRYNQLISDEIAGTENEIAGLQDQIEDLRIDIFNSSIDAAESLKDLRQSFIELQDVLSQGLEEDPFKDYKTSIKQLNLLIQDTDKNIGKIGYGADNVLSRDYTNLVDILREIETMEKTGRSDIFGENTAEMWETAHNIYETAQGDIEEYSDAIKDLYGNVQDMIDSISEMYERQNEKYEDLSNELEHYSDIITMLHGEDAYAELENVYAAQNHVYESQIEFQKNQLAQLRHEQSLFDPEKQKEAWQNLEDQIRDTENSISDLVNSSLENLRTMYENSVSSILDSWTKGAMGNDLDWLSTEWELLNRNADYYLDDVNKAFNIQQLQGKYLDMMDANNDVLLQQKISKQMEQQLGYLREKTKLSEYDVQYANAQLDILQKQIALEEAQQNKNQLKLRRDSQGNYSYAYAANENNIREAQRALDEANNNAYNMSKEQMKKTQEDAFAALSDAKSQLEEIWNSTLSDKEKQARSQTVIDSLKEYLTNTEKELTTAQKNILNDFIDATTNLDDKNKGNLDSIMKEILAGNTEAFDQIDTRFDTSRTDWMHNMDAFLSKSDEAYSQLIAASQRYQEQIKKLGEQTGTDFSDMNNLIQGTVDRTDALNKSSKELDATIQQMNVDLEKAVDSLNQFLTIFEKLSEAEFIQKLDNLLQALVEKEKEDAELANKMSGRKNKPTKVKDGVEEEPLNKPTPGTDSSNFTMTRPSALSVGSTVHLKPGAVYHEQSSGEGGQGSHNDATLIHHISGSGAYPIFLTTQSGMPRGWVRKEDLEGFRTGGYTGSWSNDDGKLALLHQKELILNEQDTQNILKAVSLVRDFAESFKSQMFTNPFTDLHKITAPLNPHTDVDQQIHITAEFPNAESASEIKDALLSLSDMAIQHSFTH